MSIFSYKERVESILVEEFHWTEKEAIKAVIGSPNFLHYMWSKSSSPEEVADYFERRRIEGIPPQTI